MVVTGARLGGGNEMMHAARWPFREPRGGGSPLQLPRPDLGHLGPHPCPVAPFASIPSHVSHWGTQDLARAQVGTPLVSKCS